MDNILVSEENKKYLLHVLKYLDMEKYGFENNLGERRLDDIVSKRMKTHLKLFFDYSII